MKLSSFVTGLACLGGAVAAPTSNAASKRQSANIDVTVLQFALTLEHLENVFYHGVLQKFTQQDFINAGYSATYYNNLMQISYDEQSHVQLLTSAIAATGNTPVAPCVYNFPYTDVPSFITLSSVLEGVGVSAYLGGAPLITSKAYLSVAASILVTEALHTSYQRAAKGEVPFPEPYGTALDPTSVYTLAAMFIVSCPASNPSLGFTPFPTLSYAPSQACTCEEPDCMPNAAIKKRDYSSMSWEQSSSYTAEPSMLTALSSMYTAMPSMSASMSSEMASKSSMYESASMTSMMTSMKPMPTPMSGNSYCAPPSAGASIMLTAASAIPAGSYVTFVSGLNVASVQGSISGTTITVAIPSFAAGQTYVFVTNMDVEGTFVDSAVLFGPAIVEVNPPAPAINYGIS